MDDFIPADILGINLAANSVDDDGDDGLQLVPVNERNDNEEV